MFALFDRRSKAAPAQYPRLPFHGIRLFQLIASLVVGGIVIFFVIELGRDGHKAPWTFIFLTAAALASIAVQAFTILLHCCTGLHPHLNLGLNGFLFALWAVSASLLTWYMSGTLVSRCSYENWMEDIGVMVCRLYKALFSFTWVAVLATVSALVLDIYVLHQQHRSGIYRLHNLDANTKRYSARRPEATRGPFSDFEPNNIPYADGGLAAPRESGVWDDPDHLAVHHQNPPRYMGRFSEQLDREPLHDFDTVSERGFEEQTEYRGKMRDS